MKHKVVDNFLSEEKFTEIQKVIMGPDFNWNYSYNVAEGEGVENEDYFIHLFYMGLMEKPKLDDNGLPIPPEKSSFYKYIEPILEKLPIENLIRAKANLYLKRNKLVHHKNHVDTKFPHKGAIFYLNDNDGFTVLEDGTEIESRANRVLFFDPSNPHHSTSCTNVKRRININFNYL